MKPTGTLSKSGRGESYLAEMQTIGIVCVSCGKETHARISESTLRSVPLVCPECQSSFEGEREWLVASLEAIGEATKYAQQL